MELAAARCLWTVLLVVAVAVFPAARGLWLELPSSGTKCVSERIAQQRRRYGLDYYAFIGEDYDANNTVVPSISVKVTSPYGNDLYHQEKVSHGQFAFTTTESGNYLACFTGDGDHHAGKKGSEMRRFSETTNARSAWYSIMSLGVCIGVSVFQLWFLRRYFQRKKLI
ncbi:Transmembrane emp24 domain-containing protein p24delta3 [Sesamum alatum]|uniref:Transmembrane emp24 domain-containing protein p24delta3 n=1 Tax=Sesamum alatum TaxID=300844 RepID=A0AAE2CPF8_9LAMI|nr:Transmembrane emp24 domain-containing protein p24delta3 [Sesamum alatum]